MLSAAEIRRFVAAAKGALARERSLAAFEIYCSSTEQIMGGNRAARNQQCRPVDAHALRDPRKRQSVISGAIASFWEA